MLPWNACMSEPNWVLKWIECHPGLAGYIQAVGVVATLMVALLGPPLARAVAHWRARLARRTATTNTICGSDESVEALLERINGRLATVDTYGDPYGTDANLVFDNLGIEIPYRLDMQFFDNEVYERARLEFLQRLSNETRGYNMMLGQMRQQGVGEGGWEAFRAKIRAKLEDLKWEATGAMGIIAKAKRGAG